MVGSALPQRTDDLACALSTSLALWRTFGAMLPDPAPSDLAPGQWKPNPPALWVYIFIGCAKIIISGVEVVLTRIGLRR